MAMGRFRDSTARRVAPRFTQNQSPRRRRSAKIASSKSPRGTAFVSVVGTLNNEPCGSNRDSCNPRDDPHHRKHWFTCDEKQGREHQADFQQTLAEVIA